MRTYNEQSLGEAVKGLTGNSREEREQFKKVGRELIKIQCAACKKERLLGMAYSSNITKVKITHATAVAWRRKRRTKKK